MLCLDNSRRDGMESKGIFFLFYLHSVQGARYDDLGRQLYVYTLLAYII